MKRFLLTALSMMLLLLALPAIAQDVEYTLNPSVSPKAMSEVEKGAKVTLDFSGIGVSVAEDAVVTATPMKEVDDGYDVVYEPDGEALSLPIAVGSEGNVYFRFDVDGVAGTIYELKLARGVVTSTDGTMANMAKSWKYFVAKEVAYTLNPTVSPKSMSEVMQGAKVTLDFGETKVALTEDAAVTATSFTEVEDGYDTETVYGDPVSLPLYLDNDGNVCFKFDVRGTAGTQYELKLARGIILSEDGTRANMLKTWKYFVADVAFNLNPTVSPKSMSDVMQGAKVTLDFGETKVALTEDAAVTATSFTEVEDGYDTEKVYGDPVSLPLYLDNDGNVCFKFDVRGTAGTQYELKLARGIILSEDGTRANMLKTWKYFVADVAFNLNPTVSPASMEEVKKGEKAILDFGDESVILSDDALVTATQMKEVDDGYEVSYVPEGEAISLPLSLEADGTVSFNFDVPGEAGTLYQLTLARGMVINEEGTKANMAKSWKYFVAEESVEPACMEVKTISPGKAKVEALSSLITINFYSQPETLAADATAELKDEETGKTYIGTITIPEYQEKVVKIRFDYGDDADSNGELCVAGSYTMTIAAGVITDKNGCTNAEISNTWIVSGPIDINDIEYVSALPQNESTLTALSSITITFPENPGLTKKLDATIKVGDYDYDFTLQNNTVTLALSPEITTNGTYKVILPAGSLYSLETGHGNKAVELTYYVVNQSLVETLFSDGEATATVYNCQGVCILRNATADDLRSLEPGFYIINGKKILKK